MLMDELQNEKEENEKKTEKFRQLKDYYSSLEFEYAVMKKKENETVFKTEKGLEALNLMQLVGN